jgi:hypothetical protein
VIGSYLLIGLAAFWPVLSHISTTVFGADADFTQSVWFIGWVPHALAHGLNPFFSNAQYVPTGVNLAQNTSSPLLGLVATPLSLAFSPLVIANLLLVVAMPASAASAFVVFQRWGVWPAAAAVGGLIYGFSPYMIGQSLGHVELLFLPLPPFIALTVVSILQRCGSPVRLGVQLGLLVAGQYLISPEVLASVALLLVVALTCVALRRPAVLSSLAQSAGVAAVVVVLILAYPVWMLTEGPQHVTGPTWPAVNPYHNDLFSFGVPGPLQRTSLWMRAAGNRLAGTSGATEAGGYIGIPLMLVAGILAWRSRRSPRTQLAMVLLLVSMVLTLGPHLAVNGRLTGIPLPFLVLDKLPLLSDILPARINFEVAAFVAAVVTFGLDDLRRAPVPGHRLRRRVARTSAVTAGAVLLVLAVTQLPLLPAQGYYVAPVVQDLPAAIRSAIPPADPNAITYPYATLYNTRPMLWQAEDGFAFRLVGGYAYHPNATGDTLYPTRSAPPGLQQFLAAQCGTPASIYGPPLRVSRQLVASAHATLARYDVRVVIVDRSVAGSGPVVDLFDRTLGRPAATAGHFSLWTR